MKNKKFLCLALSTITSLGLLVGCGQTKKEVVDVQLLMGAEKTQYVVGEKFDTTGIVLTVVYADGTKDEISDYTISNTNSLTLDDTSVYIQYQDYKFEQKIEVIEPGNKIIMIFDQGIDTVALYADGGAVANRITAINATTRTAGMSWYTKDGKPVIELKGEASNFQPLPGWYEELEDGTKRIIFEEDEKGDLTIHYVFQRWTMATVCPYREWHTAIEGKTFPIEL